MFGFNLRYVLAFCSLTSVGNLLPCVTLATPPTLEWNRQFGSNNQEEVWGGSADGLGNVYTTGHTWGVLGTASAGNEDAFLTKYDASGNLQWTQQLGTPGRDEARGVSADGLGNVYITGFTSGLLGASAAGDWDAFLTKYDASGNLQWTQQLGSFRGEISYGVSADGLGNVYISGTTYGTMHGTSAGANDAFVSKFDASGTLAWTRQLGTNNADESRSVSADGLGNVYISGLTNGNLEGSNAGGSDAFISKYDAAGTLAWTRQLGTSGYDASHGVSADVLGNVYISGTTEGTLGDSSAGSYDAFLSKYDAAGNIQWTQQLGTSNTEEGFAVSADGLGNVYISGHTGGLLGDTHAGGNDAFVSKYDTSGTLVWTHQWGTNASDISRGVSADGLGNIYISGTTLGVLDGANAGSSDAFVTKLHAPNAVVPEPSTVVLLALGGIGLIAWRRVR